MQTYAACQESCRYSNRCITSYAAATALPHKYICTIPNLHAPSNMYSGMHAAIDTKHCIMYMAIRIQQLRLQQQYLYNITLSSITYIALHIRHAPNILFYGNRHADITYTANTHATKHIQCCISSNAQIQHASETCALSNVT